MTSKRDELQSTKMPRRSGLGRFAIGVLALGFGVFASGCGVLAGDQDVDGEFLVKPHDDGTFWGWTEFTLGVDPDSVSSATIKHGFLKAPAGSKDLTFIEEVTAEVVVPDVTRQEVAYGSDFPPNDTLGPMEVLFKDDLRPFTFVEDGDDKVRIEWTGRVFDPADLPEEGVKVGVQITVDVD